MRTMNRQPIGLEFTDAAEHDARFSKDKGKTPYFLTGLLNIQTGGQRRNRHR